MGVWEWFHELTTDMCVDTPWCEGWMDRGLVVGTSWFWLGNSSNTVKDVIHKLSEQQQQDQNWRDLFHLNLISCHVRMP